MQNVLQTLLALNGLNLPPLPNPAPSMPLMPAPAPPISVGPPGPMPGVAPPAPQQPLDQSLINAISGPAPVAPTIQQPGFLDKLSTALLGISAGFQGRGGEFAQSVREERQRPQREYQAQLERYQGRKAQGVELATQKQQREQARTQAIAKEQSDRERDIWLRNAHITDSEAVRLASQAFEIQKIREQERIADERQAAQQRAQQERDARTISGRLGTGPGAAPAKIADELGMFYAKLTDKLSPAAENWRNAQARRADILASRPVSGGQGGTNARAQKAAQEIQSIKDKMIEAEARGDQQTVKQLMMRAKAAVRNAAKYPDVEAGFDQSGKWPYVKMRTGQGSTGLAPQQPTGQPQQGLADPLGIR